ncbi:hypothetical protein CDAR_253351 [Caerostris darwini]|uniref:Uncharacterized protein n=1 Tax=Caerostris darwini TaxID=1538125 RepID=A0AAV4U8D1_9ARAC|nr:hypothetical protein CDAR_253351 [Caerostris darwini]
MPLVTYRRTDCNHNGLLDIIVSGQSYWTTGNHRIRAIILDYWESSQQGNHTGLLGIIASGQSYWTTTQQSNHAGLLGIIASVNLTSLLGIITSGQSYWTTGNHRIRESYWTTGHHHAESGIHRPELLLADELGSK